MAGKTAKGRGVRRAPSLEKSDKLPASTLLLDCRGPILHSRSLLRDTMPYAFDGQAQHLLGVKPTRGEGWRGELFARLREAVEVTALQRGVERWMPKQRPGQLSVSTDR